MTAKKVAFACGMALVAAGAVAKEAEARDGFYVGLHGGAVFLRDARLGNISTSTATGTTTTTLSLSDLKQQFDTGIGVGADVGYGFANGFRVEGEVTYGRNLLGKLSGKLTIATSTGTGTTASTSSTTASFSTDVRSSVHSWAFMANGYYDFDLGLPVTPYVGVGVGAAIVTLHFVGSEDSDTVFAYQGIVGISYPVAPTASLGVEYRYFATADPNFNIQGARITSQYRAHNVFLRLTYHL
jgi:OmpA-OmpF porin, OOP family